MLLRAWRGLGGLEGKSSFRTWLYRITTNVCLDALRGRAKRVLPIDYGPASPPGGADSEEPLSDRVWIEPYPDQELGVEDGYAGPEARYERRESVELAFIAALQHLPPRQRAVLILRQVLGFSAKETAEVLECTLASVNSAMQRAKGAIDERLPDRSQQATLRALGDDGIRDLVERFVDAFEHGEIEAILSLLTEDATFEMPPYPSWCRTRDAIGESWLMPGGPAPRLRYLRTSANGQLALATYCLDDEGRSYRAIALDVLTLRGSMISEVFAFRSPGIVDRFGLPAELPA
jgi:RNA polymerase sigma-70 factor (ECF subfamily)